MSDDIRLTKILLFFLFRSIPFFPLYFSSLLPYQSLSDALQLYTSFLRFGIIFTADNPSRLKVVALTSLNLFWLPSSALVLNTTTFFYAIWQFKNKEKNIKSNKKN